MKNNSAMREQSEILILPDGKILAHNITPEMAAVLCELNPENKLMKQRAKTEGAPSTRSARKFFRKTNAPNRSSALHK